jgi:PRTRC genetic system protein E
MFVEIGNLLQAGVQLTLKISATGDGKLKVFVIPSQGESKVEGLAVPLMLCDTPELLDAGFIDAIVNYTGARRALASQVEATNALLGAAELKQSKKAVKAIAGGSNSSDTGNDDDNQDDDAGGQSTTDKASMEQPTAAASGGTDLTALFDKD